MVKKLNIKSQDHLNTDTGIIKEYDAVGAAIKRNNDLMHAITWMSPENLLLDEINQSQGLTLGIMSFM